MSLTNDDLLAISQLLDVKLKAEIQPIKNEIQTLRSEMQREMQAFKAEMRGEMQAFKAEMRGEMQTFKVEIQEEMQTFKAEMRGEMQALEAEIWTVHNNLQAQIHQMKLFQETEMMPRLNTIESCYLSTFYRYKDSVEGYEALKADNEVMKTVIMEHSEKLQKLA